MGTEAANAGASASPVPQGMHVLAKPIGPACNINCDYCFYLEKHALFKEGENMRMSDEILAAYVSSYITTQPTPAVEFVWHGGEPTLLGMEFFRNVVELQRPFQGKKQITNSIQTNGTLLTDEWCEFFKQNNFFVGLSLDGPRKIHDRYRKDHMARPTFDDVMKALKLLQKHDVEYNILACVSRETAYHPLEVYNFFKNEGVRFVQFTPLIERQPDDETKAQGLWLAPPAKLDGVEPNTLVTPWTVEPKRYGDFLIAIYEEWVRKDVGEIFIMNFEWALNAWIGNPSPVCIFARQCGRAVAMEHNGDVYACDHYVYPAYRLGNVLEESIGAMVNRSVASGFGPHKEQTLPTYCRDCEVLNACWGGCPKHRFARTPSGEPGLHYLCSGYKSFFMHIRKYLSIFTKTLELGVPASEIMKVVNNRPSIVDNPKV
jgi:uncharacterized protein